MTDQATLDAFSDRGTPSGKQGLVDIPNTGTTKLDTGSVTMTADDRVATYLIEDQMADLPDAIREGVQNGIDSPGSTRVLVNISPERTIVVNDRAGVDLTTNEGRRNLSVLGAGTKRRSDDDTIGEWGIGKGAIIAKRAVRIWSHDAALYFDYRDQRGVGPWDDLSGRDDCVVETDYHLDGLLVEIDHSAGEVPDPDSYRWRRYRESLRNRFAYARFRTGVSVVINGEPVDRDDPREGVADSSRPSLTFCSAYLFEMSLQPLDLIE